MTSYQRLKNKISELEIELAEVYRQRNMFIENKDENKYEMAGISAGYFMRITMENEMLLGTSNLTVEHE
jgi:hypothetical protein